MKTRTEYKRISTCMLVILLPLVLAGILAGGFEEASGRENSVISSVEADMVSDDFNTCGLRTGVWTAITPSDTSVSVQGTFEGNAELVIDVPAGSKHSISDSNTDAPRVMQTATDEDFLIGTKFRSNVENRYEIQGLLIEGDGENDFLRFDFYSDVVSDTTEIHLYAASLRGGVLTPRSDHIIRAKGSGEAYHMRVQREDDLWSLSYKYSDIDAWSSPYTFVYSMTVTKVGVYAGNSSAGSDVPPLQSARADYFFVGSPIPESEEDSGRNSIALNATPGGSVSKIPDKTEYACSESVQLSATPLTGWGFAGWSGDLQSLTSPEFITMTGSREITATFNQLTYTIGTSVTGNGSIAMEPDQDSYFNGDVVTLTAVADPGWTFGTWGGDVSGESSPVTLTVTDNHNVNATFTQDEYSLTVNAVGSGTVDNQPDQVSYLYNDEVTLTATASPGWTFVGWSGDHSGTVNPDSIFMTGSKTITATFSEDQYMIISSTVGAGSINVDPTKDHYAYGETITVTAVPGEGYVFAGWSGDFSGGDNPKVITATADLDITGTFEVNLAPVCDAVQDQEIWTSQALNLNLSATDSNGTTPALSATGVPTGATFTDNGNGTASLVWTPMLDDVGVYTVNFTASDGALEHSDSFQITVRAYQVMLPMVISSTD